MNEQEFRASSYQVSVTDHPDTLEIVKRPQSEWTDISMTVNGHSLCNMTLRSYEMVGMLYAMLGQVLGKE